MFDSLTALERQHLIGKQITIRKQFQLEIKAHKTDSKSTIQQLGISLIMSAKALPVEKEKAVI